ncbi:MAG: DNA-binding protein [Armatimonadetes bacterium]|nr:DNA-binding protein [Armatimonadota bacterium]
MQYTEGALGRVFVLRLQQGEPMPETLETFALDKGITHAVALMVGGVDADSRLVVGPEDGAARPVNPMIATVPGVCEVAGVGFLFPDEKGRPMLHMHAACGRGDRTVTGCIRAGVVTWQVLELVVVELTGLHAARIPDPATGFRLLQCE